MVTVRSDSRRYFYVNAYPSLRNAKINPEGIALVKVQLPGFFYIYISLFVIIFRYNNFFYWYKFHLLSHMIVCVGYVVVFHLFVKATFP